MSCSSSAPRLFTLLLIVIFGTTTPLISVPGANAAPIAVCSGGADTGAFTTTLGGDAGGTFGPSARCVGNQVSGMGAISSFSYDVAYNSGGVIWVEGMILDSADARQMASVNVTALLPTFNSGSFSTTTATFPYLTPLDPTRTYFLAFCQRLGNATFAYAVNPSNNGPGIMCEYGSIDTCLASPGSWGSFYSAKTTIQGTCDVPSPSPSVSPSTSSTPTRTPSPTSSPSVTPSPTVSISSSPTNSPTPSVSASNSPSPSPSLSPSPSGTITASPSTTPRRSPSPQDMSCGSRFTAWWRAALFV